MVESMVVISILAILTLAGFPLFTNLINDARVSAATTDFLSDVSFARAEAVKRGRLVTICRSINPENAAVPACSNEAEPGNAGRPARDWGVGWIVFVENASAGGIGSAEPGEVILARHGQLPNNINTAGANATSLTFNGAGLPTGIVGLGINFGMSMDDRFQRQVCMSRTGRMRVIRGVNDCDG